MRDFDRGKPPLRRINDGVLYNEMLMDVSDW